jgi:beta-glucosidase
MAATWDVPEHLKTFEMISDEARAKYNRSFDESQKTGRYEGLTFWTPNINIFRDPRWGRGQETYGEDPYLTSVLGVAAVKGLQGNDPKYFKTHACAKHFAVHSGPNGTVILTTQKFQKRFVRNLSSGFQSIGSRRKCKGSDVRLQCV